MPSNAEIVDAMSGAIAEGDALTIMGLAAKDICWTSHAAEPANVPWFGVFRGKRGLVTLLEAFSTVEYTDVLRKGMIADGDLVMTWTHVSFIGPTGRHSQTDEALIWKLVDGKVVSVDVFFDTAAVAAAFE